MWGSPLHVSSLFQIMGLKIARSLRLSIFSQTLIIRPPFYTAKLKRMVLTVREKIKVFENGS